MIRRGQHGSGGHDGKPRASGDDPDAGFDTGAATFVNPARAGMIRSILTNGRCDVRKPRASGDDPRLYRSGIVLRM